MALEMRVYEELTNVDPKIMIGLTMRQLGAVSLLVVVLAVTAPVLWLLGHQKLIAWVVIPPAVPLVAWAWIKPMGLRFEVWLRLWWRFATWPKRRMYANWAAWSPLDRDTFEGKKAHVVGKRKREVVVEAGH